MGWDGGGWPVVCPAAEGGIFGLSYAPNRHGPGSTWPQIHMAPDPHGCHSYRSAPAGAFRPRHLVGQLYEKDAKLLTAACSVPPRSNSPGFVPITAFAQMGGLTMDALPLTAAGYGYGDGTSFFVRNPILDQDYSFPLNSCKVRR